MLEGELSHELTDMFQRINMRLARNNHDALIR